MAKKLKKGKYILYLLIMFFAIGGSGFFVYKNYDLGVKSKGANKNPVFDIESLSEITRIEIEKTEDRIDNKESLSTNIIYSRNFSELEDYTIGDVYFEFGKENIFQSNFEVEEEIFEEGDEDEEIFEDEEDYLYFEEDNFLIFEEDDFLN